MKIRYDEALIKCMSLFQSKTQAELKDCFVDELSSTLTFIVQPGQIGKAIGKQGSTIHHLEAMMKRRIRVVEFNPSLLQFIQNMIMPMRVDDAQEDDGIVVLTPKDSKTRGILIGRSASALRNLEKNVKRYYPGLKEIKVV